MTADNPAGRTGRAGSGVPQTYNLALRIASAVVLAPVAVVVAVVGGWLFVLFWTAAAIGIACEWNRMIAERRGNAALVAAAAGLGAAGVSLVLGDLIVAIAVIALAAVVAAALGKPGRRGWAAAGTAYAGIVLVAPEALRQDARFGVTALIFLFAVVWATDILGYFGGRLFGGPKLWPRVSPKKTWSGAIGGAIGAVAAGAAVAFAVGLANPLVVAALALLLSAASQAGDLVESAVKRSFGVKDASRIIPGHGGIMDRLDGFLAAALLAAIIGVLRGGLDAAARGLLVW